VFRVRNESACRHLWKCAVDHHVFFRLPHNTQTHTSQSSAGRWFTARSTIFRRSRRSIQRQQASDATTAATFTLLGGRKVHVDRRPSHRFPPRRSTLSTVNNTASSRCTADAHLQNANERSLLLLIINCLPKHACAVHARRFFSD